MPIADARHLKTLLICPHRPTLTEIAPLLAAALPNSATQKLTTFVSRKEAAEVLRTFDARICFLDFASPGNGGFATLDVLQSVAPDLIVVALLPANNPDTVLRCLRSGAADFLVAPFTPDQVDAVLEKVVRRVPAPALTGSPARVIAAIPVKGSTGATTLACNLAVQCQRLGATRVLLADLDALTGSVSFVLKLKSNYSFLDVLHHAGALDKDLWKQMVTDVKGIDVLLAPEGVPDPATDLSSATPILDFVRYSYEVIVADCGGPEGNWNLSVARAADEVLLITTNEVPELHAAGRALVYLEANGVEKDTIRVVVNRYADDNGLHRDCIGAALRHDPFAVVPLDTAAVERSLMDGAPIASGTLAGKSLAALAMRLVNIGESIDGKRKGTGRLLSFLSRG